MTEKERDYEAVDHQPRRNLHQDRGVRGRGTALQSDHRPLRRGAGPLPRVIDQADYRKEAILKAVTEAGYKLSDFAAVCGRGGLYRAIPSGTYAVNDRVMADVEAAPYGEHPSNLGAYLARKLGDMVGIPAFFVDPVCVDEMTEVAHYTGFAAFRRLCQFHALNHKAVGRKAAEKLGKNTRT